MVKTQKQEIFMQAFIRNTGSSGETQIAKDNKISFRWGMYCGSKKGKTVPKDALLFVTGATIR